VRVKRAADRRSVFLQIADFAKCASRAANKCACKTVRAPASRRFANASLIAALLLLLFPSAFAFAEKAGQELSDARSGAGSDAQREAQGNAQGDSKADDELETKNIFGFTAGTDIGANQELELELETNLAFGKRKGAYNLGEQFVTLEYNPTDWIEADTRVRASFNQIKGVDGLDDRTGANFGGLAGRYAFVLIHRAPATPVGLTVSVEPEWSRVDDGGQVNSAFSAESRIIIDTELVPATLYGALNAIYQPLESRFFGATEWTRSSAFGFAAALAYRLDPALARGPKQVVLGAELEYYRAHDTLAFKGFSGDSLSFGPTLYIHFNDKLFLEAAISTAIAGRAVGDPNPLDLIHFSRNKAQMTIGIEF
jgi:hypothetical protein